MFTLHNYYLIFQGDATDLRKRQMRAKVMFISGDLPTDSSPSLSPKKPVRKSKKTKATAKATHSSPPRKKKKHQATTSSPVSI